MNQVLRNERGHLQPGSAPLNPGGRPKVPEEVKREVQEIFSAATPRAAQRLVDLMEDPDSRIALAAASTLLDRVLGKAVTSVDQKVSVSNSIQQAHLAALIEIQNERKKRLEREAASRPDKTTVIDVTPQSGDE